MLENIQITKKDVKNITLKVKPSGEVILTAPKITSDAPIILAKEIVIFFIPKGPIFFLRLINNNTVENRAEILVPEANPLIPINFDNNILKIAFITTAIAAFTAGVLVSCKE